MSDTYDDGGIICGPRQLEIRHYYFPFGTKVVPYSRIKAYQRVEINGVLSGKWRIWGTGNPRYWANLDWRRPTKKVGFVLDLGGVISPIVTPDNPDSFDDVLRHHTGLEAGRQSKKGPFI